MTIKALCLKYNIQTTDIDKSKIMTGRTWQHFKRKDELILRVSLQRLAELAKFFAKRYGKRCAHDLHAIVDTQLANRKLK